MVSYSFFPCYIVMIISMTIFHHNHLIILHYQRLAIAPPPSDQWRSWMRSSSRTKVAVKPRQQCDLMVVATVPQDWTRKKLGYHGFFIGFYGRFMVYLWFEHAILRLITNKPLEHHFPLYNFLIYLTLTKKSGWGVSPSQDCEVSCPLCWVKKIKCK